MTNPRPGKFEGNESLEVSEFLYSLTQDGFIKDELGDVEEFGWYGIIDMLPDYVSEMSDEEFMRLEESWPAPCPDCGRNPLLERPPFGRGCHNRVLPAYIVRQDNNGFFTYTGYDSNESARKEWKKLTDEYLDFIGNDDVEVSSE